MAVIRSSIRALAGTTMLAVLAACGGGGDDSGSGPTPASDTTTVTTTTTTAPPAAADVVDKYVGNWGGCFADSRGGTGSSEDRLTLTKTSATTANFTFSGRHFTGRNCTGTVDFTDGPSSGTASWVGTKTVGGETVDKINIVEGGRTNKQIVVIRADGKLYSGVDAGDGGPVDAEGYPTTLQAQGDSKLS